MINNITEDYCSFEVSKLLKEKGFGVACNGKYQHNKEWEHTDTIEWINYNTSWFEGDISSPTHSLAIKWIRENFGIHISIDLDDESSHEFYKCKVLRIIKEVDYEFLYVSHHNSIEKATEAALLYTLQNLIK